MNSLGIRFLYVFLSTIPFIILLIMILNNNSLIFTDGYLVSFVFYFFLLYFYLKYTIFDWDIYIIGNSKVEIKKLFKKSEVLFVEEFKLSNRGFLTALLFLYTIKINNRNFLVKLKPIGNFTIFCIEKETEKQYEKMKNRIFQTITPQV